MMKPVSLVLSWHYLLPKIVWTTEYIYMQIYFKDLERLRSTNSDFSSMEGNFSFSSG